MENIKMRSYWWEENGKELAIEEGFTKEQTKEYKEYINICKKLNGA